MNVLIQRLKNLKAKSPMPFYLFGSLVILALLVTASGLWEMKQSKDGLMELMKKQTHSLLETVIISSQNSLAAEGQLESTIRERLLDNAAIIKQLYEQGRVNDQFLEDYAAKHNLFRINIFNRNGERVYGSFHGRGHGFGMGMGMGNMSAGQGRGNMQRGIDLTPLFNGNKDTIIIGIKNARFRAGTRYAVALRTRDSGAIVVNVEADQLSQLKTEGNLNNLVTSISSKKEIVFFALQDSAGLVASSENAAKLEAIDSSSFLKQALKNGDFNTRVMELNNVELFEAVHIFTYPDNTTGLIRIGLSLEYLKELNRRIVNRLILNTFLLLVAGVIIFFFISLKQNYQALKGQYKVAESFSADVIDTVSDAIIVYTDTGGIKIFNPAAEQLFDRKKDEVTGKPLSGLIDNASALKGIEAGSHISDLNIPIGLKMKYLMVAKNDFYDETGQLNYVLVIRDYTERRKLELQLQRKERLTAMGSLAAGVAHEVRNPLNSIGTIAQQLDKDFTPAGNEDQYHKLARIIYSEVKRIDATISNFLKFARPDLVTPRKILLSRFFTAVSEQVTPELGSKNIELFLSLNEDTEVVWDSNQIHQVMINLIRNAAEAITGSGKIEISVFKTLTQGREIEIHIKDNGAGIPEELQSKIFNLYFTTKAKGTGIGLSIVQKIIDEHNGSISVESRPGEGTTFIIQMPLNSENA